MIGYKIRWQLQQWLEGSSVDLPVAPEAARPPDADSLREH